MPILLSAAKRLRQPVAAVCVLLAGAFLAGTAPAVAGATPLKMIWGPPPPAGNLANGRSPFRYYHKLGVQVYQTELLWSQVAVSRPSDATSPNDPAYQWPSYIDQAVSQARQHGIAVCLLVQRTPGWANGGQANYWAPYNAADYANFLIAAARRYRSVHYWMIWGEPTTPGNFAPMPPYSPVGPERYAVLLNAAYHALKSVSRHNKVIGGDTFTAGLVPPELFIRWMRLPNGKPPPLDLYGHNPYSARFPGYYKYPEPGGWRDLNQIRTLHRQLVDTYHHQVKLWLSEYGIPSSAGNVFPYYVSPKGQAAYVRAAYRYVNNFDFVKGLGWYQLLDQPPWDPEHLTSGLMTWDAKPKPAFWAYKRVR